MMSCAGRRSLADWRRSLSHSPTSKVTDVLRVFVPGMRSLLLPIAEVYASRLRAYRARGSILDRDVTDQKYGLALREPISVDQISGNPLENRLYCLLYTFVLFTASPLAFVPVWVMVMVLPSAETTTFDVIVAFPPFFHAFS